MYSWKCVSSAPFGRPVVPGGVDDDRGVVGPGVGHRAGGRRRREQAGERDHGTASCAPASDGCDDLPDDDHVADAGLRAPASACSSTPAQVTSMRAELCAEVEGDLVGLQQHVERHHDGTRLEDAEVGHEERRDVRQLERDPLSGTATPRSEQRHRRTGRRGRPARRTSSGRRPTSRPACAVRRSGLTQDDGQVEHAGAPRWCPRGTPAELVVPVYGDLPPVVPQ